MVFEIPATVSQDAEAEQPQNPNGVNPPSGFVTVRSRGLAVMLTNHNFNSNHDTFITHLDRSSVKRKVRAFLVPLFFHIFLLGVLLWRIFVSSSSLRHLISVLCGTPLSQKIQQITSWPRFALLLAFDLLIYTSIPRLTWRFITGHLLMRIKCGFRPVEIVFRRPTGPSIARLAHLSPSERHIEFTNSIYAAMDPRLLRANVGDNTRSDFWELDYSAPIAAYVMVAKGQLGMETWELSVWQWAFNSKWTVWAVNPGEEVQTNEKAVKHFVATLQAQGKEDLVRRWLAFIEENGKKGSGEKVQEQVNEMFKADGVDFPPLWLKCVEEARSEYTRTAP